MGNQLRDALKKAGIGNSSKAVPRNSDSKGQRPAVNPSHTQAKSRVQIPRGGLDRRLANERKVAMTAREREKLALQLRAIRDAYGTKKKPGPAKRKPTLSDVSCTQTGPIEFNPILRAGFDDQFVRAVPLNAGIATQLTANPADASDLILGLDFGTSSVKAVIRDHTLDQAFAVPFGVEGDNRYLLPSRVYRSGDTYALDKGDAVIRDLKLRLLNSMAPSPAQEFDDACAFIALVIRHCRGWLLTEYEPRYRNHELNWRLNLGLAARSYEEKRNVDLFRRLAWAALNLASDESTAITGSLVRQYREHSRLVLRKVTSAEETGFPFTASDADVVPEIAAEIFGFVQSTRWDSVRHTIMMMCDIGAGTVDVAVFGVTRQGRGLLRFVFFANDVQPLGMVNLHRERLAWLKTVLHAGGLLNPALEIALHDLELPTDQQLPIPKSITDYLTGVSFSVPDPALAADAEFFVNKYAASVFRCIRVARREKGIPDNQLQQTPLFLCGGGSRYSLYSRIVASINEAPINVTVSSTPLPRPEELIAPGLRERDYDRISVAYGLSREGAGGRPLGEYVRAIDVPPIRPMEPVDYAARFIDKSMV